VSAKWGRPEGPSAPIHRNARREPTVPEGPSTALLVKLLVVSLYITVYFYRTSKDASCVPLGDGRRGRC